MSYFPKLSTVLDKIRTNSWPTINYLTITSGQFGDGTYLGNLYPFIDSSLEPLGSWDWMQLEISNTTEKTWWVTRSSSNYNSNGPCVQIFRFREYLTVYNGENIFYKDYNIENFDWDENLTKIVVFDPRPPEDITYSQNYIGDGAYLIVGDGAYSEIAAGGYTYTDNGAVHVLHEADPGTGDPPTTTYHNHMISIPHQAGHAPNGPAGSYLHFGSILKCKKNLILLSGKNNFEYAYSLNPNPYAHRLKLMTSGYITETIRQDMNWFQSDTTQVFVHRLIGLTSNVKCTDADFAIISGEVTYQKSINDPETTDTCDLVIVELFPGNHNRTHWLTQSNGYQHGEIKVSYIPAGTINWNSWNGSIPGGITTTWLAGIHPVATGYDLNESAWFGDTMSLSGNGKILFFQYEIGVAAGSSGTNFSIATIPWDSTTLGFVFPSEDPSDTYSRALIPNIPCIINQNGQTNFGHTITSDYTGNVVAITAPYTATTGGWLYIFLKSPQESEVKYTLMQEIEYESSTTNFNVYIPDDGSYVMYHKGKSSPGFIKVTSNG